MAVRLLQPSKAYNPMLVTLAGMVMEVRLLQPSKAWSTMSVNCEFSEKVTEVREQHLLKANLPMFFTSSPTTTSTNLHSSNALDGMSQFTISLPVQPAKACFPIVFTLLGMETEARRMQPEKVEPPMLVTFWGILMELRLIQPLKASSPMLVTLSGRVMEVRL